MEPQVGQVVTVFRSRLVDSAADVYGEHAQRIGELARTMPGYVEHKVFLASDGERVTLVTFADREAHNAWRDHPEHRAAQRAGIDAYYDEYSIAVGAVEYASHFKRPTVQLQ
ncbi:MAG: antibiotic biosynthesis monooxygenase family protein [Sporichthyaceae bacterium]